MSSEKTFPTTGLSQLHRMMLDAFSLDDLRGLCLDLSIDYEDLPGEARPRKIRELLLRLQQRDQLPELIQHLQELRPHVDWASFQPAEPEAEPPFKGLQYFREQDAHLFFGRDALTAELIDHLNRHRFLAVVGASGSGKSSVVRAGLVPALRSSEVAWLIAPPFTPGQDETPLAALVGTLLILLEPELSEADRLIEKAKIAAALKEGTLTAPSVINRILQKNPQASNFLLIVDQFEELFTQCDDPEERQLFVGNLIQGVQGSQQGRLKLVVTLRADFYAYAVQFEVLRPLLETRQKIVGAMTGDELRQAIEGPAAANEWQFQPGLVDTILTDVGATENRQPEPGALPLLSHALLETWRRREGRTMTLAGYQAAGGVRQAIATTADRLYTGFTPTEQRIARHIFLRLTELGEGTEDTRRRASLAELMPQVEDAENVQGVLQQLADARLVTTAAESAEVAHEALIREWPALRQWLDENREGLRIHRQLMAAAQNWQANGEDKSYLYQGVRLAQAEDWGQDGNVALTSLEQDFLRASRAEESKRIRLRRLQAAGVMVVLLIIIVGLLVANSLIRAQEAETGIQATKAAQNLETATAALLTATVAQGEALVNLNTAVIAQDEAQDEATRAAQNLETANTALETATAAQGEAQIEATRAAQNFETANIALETATAAQGEAQNEATRAAFSLATATVAQGEAQAQGRLALAQSVAVLSELVYQESNDSELAALLAIEAYRINREGAGNIQRLVESSLRPLLDHVPPYFNPSLRGHEGIVFSVAFSPDGERLASGSADGTIRLWDLSRPGTEPVVLTGHGSSVLSVAFSPDGDILASGSADATIRLWDLSQPGAEPMVLTGHEATVYSVAFSPDGDTLASSSDDATVRLWDLSRPGAEQVVLTGHEAVVYSVAFSPDGERLASASLDGTIRLWDSRQPGVEPVVLLGHENSARSVAFSPNGEILASGSLDATIRLWDLSRPEAEPMVLTGHEDSILSVAFSPDGDTLASGSLDNTIRLWDLGRPEVEPVALPGHQSWVYSVTFSPDGQTLASGSVDATIRLWDLSLPRAEPVVLTGHEDIVRSVAFSSNGQILASGSEDATIRLWNLSQPEAEPMVLTGHESIVRSVAFSPDGQTLASGSVDATIRLWDLSQPGAEPMVLTGHEGAVFSVAFSPDGETLASGSADATIRLWDLSQPEAEPMVLTGHEDWVYSVTFSPDGETLASGSWDNTIRLWELSRPGAEPMVLRRHEDKVLSVAFSLDGGILASGSADNTIRLWDLSQPGAEPVMLRGHQHWVTSVVFSPDGQTLASGSLDETIRLWDLNQPGAELVVLRGHEDIVLSVAFSPDGQTLASGSADDTVRLWVLLERLVEIGCGQVRRNLTWEEWQQYLPGEPYRQTCPELPPHPSVPLDE